MTHCPCAGFAAIVVKRGVLPTQEFSAFWDWCGDARRMRGQPDRPQGRIIARQVIDNAGFRVPPQGGWIENRDGACDQIGERRGVPTGHGPFFAIAAPCPNKPPFP